MEIKIYKNLNDCRKLWNGLSPDNSLFDRWDFRQCFYNKSESDPYFLVGKKGKDILGLAPLNRSKNTNQFTYFGGWFPERNSFFVKEGAILSELLQRCPDNTLLEGISPEEGKYYKFDDDEYTFYIDLARYGYSFDKYFSSFDRKKQKNFKRDIKSIPKYKVHVNRLRDFKRMVELNIKQFDEESIYNDKNTRGSIEKMFKLAHSSNLLQMISVEINGKTEGIDVGILFGKYYHVITGSSNNQKIPNLGKLMTVLSIKNAISKKSRYVDFLASSGYWKNQWNFDKEMLFKFS